MERSSLGMQRVPGFRVPGFNHMVCNIHSMVKALGTSLQQHGYSAEKQNPHNTSGTSTPP